MITKRGFFGYLEPADALAEILFGLIMVLTFTLAAGFVAGEGAGGVRELLVATLGCNIAWGIIDGAMYLMGTVMENGRHNRVLRAIQAEPDDDRARLIVQSALDGTIASAASEAERSIFYRLLVSVARKAEPGAPRVLREDWMGALNCFILVVGATLPAAVPFLLIRDDPFTALRVSNLVLALLLFGVGFAWARLSGLRPWRAGLFFLLASLALVALTVSLGG